MEAIRPSDWSRPAPLRRGEAGFSLIEMMVSILLLGIILAAGASSLIQFNRTAADNERRVQATALMNRVHEELQGLPWRDAVLYEEELQELFDEGLDGLTREPDVEDGPNVWRFDGEELVTIEGPGGSDRREDVPYVRDPVPLVIDGRGYELLRFITWSDPVAGIKRFTTVVGWSLYNREYEERFLSERAATSTEAGDPERPRVVQFDVGPSPMPLTEEPDAFPGFNSGELAVRVRFSSGVTSAHVTYEALVVTGTEPLTVTTATRTVTMTPHIWDSTTGLALAFRGTIPASTQLFDPGTTGFLVEGTGDARGVTSVTFLGNAPIYGGDGDADTGDGGAGDGGAAIGEPVSVSDVIITPTNACVDNKGKLRSTVSITAIVQGLTDDDHRVTVELYNGDQGITRTMQPDPLVFSDDTATFKLVLDQTTDYGYRFPPGTGNSGYVESTAVVTAERPSDGDGAIPGRAESTMVLRVNNHGGCS